MWSDEERLKYDLAMGILDHGEADRYFEVLVQDRMTSDGKAREEAARIERVNLGYYAGYFPDEVRERVERLFRCAHPFFGSIAEKGPPTFEQAFAMGVRLGREMAGNPTH